MKSINRSGGRRTRLDAQLDRALESQVAQQAAIEAPPDEAEAPPVEPAPAEAEAAPDEAPPGAPAPTPGAAPSPSPSAGAETATGPTVEPGKVGIVFVHGIGTQVPCETLLSWSEPIVSAVGAWAMADDAKAGTRPGAAGRRDLVVRSDIDFVGGTTSFIELDVPAVHDADGTELHPAQRWVMTEAWWASSVAAPPLGAVLDWSTRQGVLGRVVKGIIGNSSGGGNAITRFLARFGLEIFLTLTSSLTALGYSVVRTIAAIIPIQEVRDAVVFTAFEGFLMRWWGDVYVLLRDPVQSANVRHTIAETAMALRSDGCGSIVILAHSGGTVASYMTLDDPVHQLLGKTDDAEAYPDRARVTKLITHGQAINLVRALPAGSYESAMADRTFDRIQPPLRWTGRWVDFWATHDPAPSGPIQIETSTPRPDFETRMVWNRRSIREDHGAYLTNDEEFIVPVLRELDTPEGTAEESRFPEPTCEAIDARRQRVHVLTMWRRFAFVAPLVAVLLTIPGDFAGSGIGALTAIAAEAWTFIPGHEAAETVVSGIQQLTAFVDLAALVGLATLIAIALALSIHAAMPIRQSRVWRDQPGTFLSVVFLDWVPAAAIIGVVAWPLVSIVVGAVLQVGRSASFLPVLGLALAILVLMAAQVSRSAEPTGRRGRPRWSEAIASTVLFLAALGSISLTAVAILTNDIVRTIVVGTAIAFLAYRPLVGFGSRRWDRWDRLERAAFRHGRPRPPRRAKLAEAVWLVIIGIVLAMGLVGSAVTMPGLGAVSLLWVALVAIAGYALIVSLTDATEVSG